MNCVTDVLPLTSLAPILRQSPHLESHPSIFGQPDRGYEEQSWRHAPGHWRHLGQ